MAQHFKDLHSGQRPPRRCGEELLERLENETDFFEAPAGAKPPRRFPQVAWLFSLNAYRRLVGNHDPRPDAQGRCWGLAPISEQEEETVAILGLLA
ncbi:MAG: hypothetical protein ACLTQP_01020 [Faecalibacterium prausnitzii]